VAAAVLLCHVVTSCTGAVQPSMPQIYTPSVPLVFLQATCFAFGTQGLFFCPLGPLAAPGPTWWKVGFLSSQLPRALPLAPLGGDTYQGRMLLVGWWVPEQ
jgi:hypothetical protein